MKIFLKKYENIIDIYAIWCNNMDKSKRYNFNKEVEGMKNFKNIPFVKIYTEKTPCRRNKIHQ